MRIRAGAAGGQYAITRTDSSWNIYAVKCGLLVLRRSKLLIGLKRTGEHLGDAL